jgi:hypothetical protein
LVVCVSNNPKPICFNLKCWGTEPTLDLIGPWTDELKAAEENVAHCTDKKKLKELNATLVS